MSMFMGTKKELSNYHTCLSIRRRGGGHSVGLSKTIKIYPSQVLVYQILAVKS